MHFCCYVCKAETVCIWNATTFFRNVHGFHLGLRLPCQNSRRVQYQGTTLGVSSKLTSKSIYLQMKDTLEVTQSWIKYQLNFDRPSILLVCPTRFAIQPLRDTSNGGFYGDWIYASTWKTEYRHLLREKHAAAIWLEPFGEFEGNLPAQLSRWAYW